MQNSPRHLIITVHGIRTFGHWQERLEKILKTERPSIKVVNYKFGYFSILAFLIPFLRWLVTRRFRKEMVREVEGGDWDRIDIVAHSFGTHLVGWGMHGIDHQKRPKIHTIIFAGSVLKSGFPWRNLVGSSIKRVVNECGVHDESLLINQLIVLFTGMAGREGFSGMTSDNFRNRFFEIGHSGYFQLAGKPNDSFMLEKWIPLLLTEENVSLFPDPRPTSALRGFLTFLYNNAEPIKLCLWLSPLIFGILWINQQRQLAVKETIRARDHLRMARVQEFITVDPTAAAVFLREIENPKGIREWRQRALELLKLKQELSTAQPIIFEHEVSDENLFGIVEITSIGFSPDGNKLVTTAWNNPTTIWDINKKTKLVSLGSADAGENLAVFSPTGSYVVTASEEGGVAVWRTDNFTALTTFQGHEDVINSIQFSHDAKKMVTASDDGTVGVWVTDWSEDRVVLQGHSDSVTFAEFSPHDSNLILTASLDGTARLWKFDGSWQSTVLGRHENLIWHAVFNLEGTKVVTASSDATAKVWNVSGTGEPQVLKGHSGPLRKAVFSADGSRILTSSHDGTARVWNIKESANSVILRHRAPVLSAQFSQDGTQVLTGAADGTAKIWSTETPTEPLVQVPKREPREAFQAPVIDLDTTSAVIQAKALWSPNESHIVTALDQLTPQSVHVWIVSIDELKKQLWRLTNKCLGRDRRMILLGENPNQAIINNQKCLNRVNSQNLLH